MSKKIRFLSSILCLCLSAAPIRAAESLLPDEDTEVVEGQLEEEDLTALPLEAPPPSPENGKISMLKACAVVLTFITTATIGLLLSSHNTGKNA